MFPRQNSICTIIQINYVFCEETMDSFRHKKLAPPQRGNVNKDYKGVKRNFLSHDKNVHALLQFT